MQTHNEIIEIIAAHRDGKKLQYRGTGCSSENWRDVADNSPSWDFRESEYRIKPAPVKRLVRVEELPMPCFLKLDCFTVVQVLQFGPTEEIGIKGAHYGIPKCSVSGFKYSHDGKTWKSFEIEVEA